jgi:hypothetical protein
MYFRWQCFFFFFFFFFFIRAQAYARMHCSLQAYCATM